MPSGPGRFAPSDCAKTAAPGPALIWGSADAGQLLAYQHVDDPRSPEGRTQHHPPRLPRFGQTDRFCRKVRHLTRELWQTVASWSATDGGHALISFKGAQFPKDVILFAAFFYVRYTVFYLDREEIMTRLGVAVDHATFNRLVTR